MYMEKQREKGMFDPHERDIRKVLRCLTKQRLVAISPGNVWAIEQTVKKNRETDAALATCRLRGWAEIMEDKVPSGDLPLDGHINPNKPLFTHIGTLYRITDSGWAAIYRSHQWNLTAVYISLASLIVSFIALLVTLKH
jgi:hypothetical protein